MSLHNLVLAPLLSLIAVIPAQADSAAEKAAVEKAAAEKPAPTVIKEGNYTYTLDSGTAPDLKSWLDGELAPVIKEWYPKIMALLPSDGYKSAQSVTFSFRDDMKGVPAWTVANTISMNAEWFRHNIKGEDRGCVVHEMVHVVQHYGGGPGKNPVPGWITEGIPDYIRWFLYEPQTKGAEITRGNVAGVKYDASYRVSANFIDWVIRTKDKDLLQKLNAAAREGKYTPELWKERTKSSLEDLGAEWKKSHEERLAK